MKNNISGLGVALITPFTNSGEVDFRALENLVNYLINNGVDYLVALGTTGETATLTSAEKSDILSTIAKTTAGRVPLMVGLGGNNTAEVVETIRNFDFSHFASILSVAPYYNKPSQEGVYQHYKAISEVSPVPVVLYNILGRTGINMTAATTLRLAHDFKNIVGIKEASGDLAQAAYIIRDAPEGFSVISGDDNQMLPLAALGGAGLISVAANAFPKQFSEMTHLALSGQTAAACAIHMQFMEVVDALFTEGNPTGIKAVLEQFGWITNRLRLPLVPASLALRERLKGLIDQYHLCVEH